MPLSFVHVFVYARLVAQRYRQGRARKVSLLAAKWKYGNSLVKRRKGNYASFSELPNILKNVLSKRIAS